MGAKCSNVVTDASFISRVVDETTFKLYEYLVAKSYVRTHKMTRWCPNPECKKAVFATDLNASVTCECGTKFCVRCGNESHAPVGCDILQQWQQKLQSDGTRFPCCFLFFFSPISPLLSSFLSPIPSMEWVRLFSKPCPNRDCQMPIQKNGGCQFMTCQSCRTPYCWDCMKVLAKDHEPHPCQKEEETKKEVTLERSKFELQDYSKCVEGFDLFMNKSKNFVSMRPTEAKKQKEYNYMVSDNFSNFRFYEDSLDALIEASRIAKYSFIFQFYSRDNAADFQLFCFNQKTLIEDVCAPFLFSLASLCPHFFLSFPPQVEELEKILKRDIVLEKDKSELMEKSRTVKFRALTVTKSVEEGLTKNADLFILKS